MSSIHDSIAWLQQRAAEYRSGRNDISEVVEDFDDLREKETFMTQWQLCWRSFKRYSIYLFVNRSKMALFGFDRRRINGPEESRAPVFDDIEAEDGTRWTKGMPRKGRRAMDIRPICVCKDYLVSQGESKARFFIQPCSFEVWTNRPGQWICVH